VSEGSLPPARRQLLAGHCTCEGVRFEVTEPLVSAGWCHCTRCRHRTGAHASPGAAVAPGSFRITTGEELVTEWTPPGGGFIKAFCSVCGGHLYSRSPDDPDRLSIRLGAVEGDPGIRPQYHQFTANAAVWQPLPDDGLPRYEGRRP
jgi:hypothetical protein